MSKRNTTELTPHARRRALAEDISAFLEAGNKIEVIPSGVSGQDRTGRGQAFRLAPQKK